MNVPISAKNVDVRTLTAKPLSSVRICARPSTGLLGSRFEIRRSSYGSARAIEKL